MAHINWGILETGHMSISRMFLLSFTFITAVAIVGKGHVSSQNEKQSEEEKLEVVTAVAPVFHAFVFGETGENTITVEVTVDGAGKVVSANVVKATFLLDRSVEKTAKQWRFSPAKDINHMRTGRIVFVFRTMPKGTPREDLTTIYIAPYQMELRHEVFAPYTTSDPNPDKVKPSKP